MRKLFTILFLTMSLILVAAGTATAQTYTQNTLGLDSGTVYGEWCVYGPSMTVYTVSLVLHEPVNPDFDGTGAGQPVTNVGGFECRLWGEGDVDILDVRFPVNAINAGTEDDEQIVGFAEPVPVVDGIAVLALVDVFLWMPGTKPVPQEWQDKASPLPCDNYNATLSMAPLRGTPSIADKMAFLDADDPQDPLVAADNSLIWFEGDVELLLEAMIVETEDQSWGTMKALYR